MHDGPSEAAEMLGRLECLIGKSAARSVMLDVANDLTRIIEEMEQSVRLLDQKAIRSHLHALVGVSANFGVFRVELLSREFQDSPPVGVGDLEILKCEISTVVSDLRALLGWDVHLIGENENK